MARTTTSKVKEIIQTSVTDDTISTIFVPVANRFVTARLGQTILAEDELTDIELYVAAHFVAISEERGGLQSTRIGAAEEELSDIHQGGLAMTRYGQQAMALDHTDTLKSAIVERKQTSVNYTSSRNPEFVKPAEFRIVGGSRPGW